MKRYRGYFDGMPGESLFTRPLHPLVRENELPALFKKVEGMNDHRLLTLVTAMLVEDRLDKLLSSFLPKYESLRKTNISTKFKILEALNFVPPLIIRVARCLTEIRNVFAHDLAKVSFDDLLEDQKNFLRNMHSEIHISRAVDPDGNIGFGKIFHQLSFFSIGALDAYTSNLNNLREEISKDDFVQRMHLSVKEEEDTILKMLDQLPINSAVQYKDVLIVRTEKGGTITRIKKSE